MNRPDFLTDDFVGKRVADAEGWVEGPHMEARYEAAAEGTVPGDSDNIVWNEVDGEHE